MKVAVTGATGFIGHHVLNRLATEDVSIISVGRDKSKWNGIGNFVQHDIGSRESHAYDKLGRPDTLIHLAWDGLPNYNSPYHFEKEMPRQYAFLKSMADDGVKNISAAGTCLEYGIKYGCLGEQLTPAPITSYGIAKNTLRQQLELLALSLKFEFNWLRLFYVWGEGQAHNSLYSLLQKAVSRRAGSFDMSGGEQLRDYLPVADAADYIARVALQATSHDVTNICSGQPISVRRLVEQWISDNNWKINLNLGRYSYPDYEPLAFWGDNKKLLSLIR